MSAGAEVEALMVQGARLKDLGERAITKDILEPRYGTGRYPLGNDCAYLANVSGLPTGGAVVVTTDPAPRPVASRYGFTDYYYWGWLLAAVNWSDIAAVGAEPLGLLTSLSLPSDLPVANFLRLLDGIDACSSLAGGTVVGGNIREAESENCEATAMGFVDTALPLSRQTAAPGQVVVVFGNTGYFWAAVEALERNISLETKQLERLESALLEPVPLVSLGQALRREAIVSACTDSSDGLWGTLRVLGLSSGLGVEIDADNLDTLPLVREVALSAGVDALRMMLGFGDLQLVVTVDPSNLDSLRGLASEFGCAAIEVGRTLAAPDGQVFLNRDGSRRLMANFDNERFASSSQFTAGFSAFRERLLKQPLTV
jgi:thiamine-monophosphate kinase